MHWKELEKEINRRAQTDAGFRDDSHYFQALASLNWDQAGRDISRNIEAMCEFLDHYRPQDERIDIDQGKLQGVWLETVEPLADCVENVYLERHGMLKAEDKKGFGVQCVGQAIQKMYDELAGVPRVGLTNASKLLHLRFPKLFVMTDERIRRYWSQDIRLHELYGRKETELFQGYGYTFIFLPFIKSHAVDAIMSYVNDQGVAISEAISRLGSLGGKSRTIAKLIHEYYYAITRR
jgi:hypothetical protein